MKNNIIIDFKLTTRHNDNISFSTEGSFEEKENCRRIVFKEPTEGNALTHIDIYNDKVLLERFGEFKTKMVYILNEETTVEMKTNFNYSLSMAVYTTKLNFENTSLMVEYQTEIDKEHNDMHILELKYSFL